MSTTPNLDYGSMGFKEIIVKLDGDNTIAIITLNRANERNTFSPLLVEEIVEVFGLLDRDDRVRVIIFTADPSAPAFCSGAMLPQGDLGWSSLYQSEAEREGPQAHRDLGGVVTIAILRCRKITISAVNGHAVGAGITALQLPFDFRLIWEGAKLAFPFVRRGIAPEACSSYLLPKLIGNSASLGLFLSGDTYSPRHHFLQPLYYSIHPNRSNVLPAALQLAYDLAENTSQPAIAMTKALVWRGKDTIEEQHLLESLVFRGLSGAGDGNEGVRAFKERRKVGFEDKLGDMKGELRPWWTEVDIRHRKAKL
ncbi:peroxisomal enoyl-CoA-hydratase [Abortiporus biennis]|nr:peroxisomal enoyl-CoA-hydratase [Abortiporus biennis]